MSTAKPARAKNINKAEADETRDNETFNLTEPAREEIERRAYELYLVRGGIDGHDQEDWLEAERELREVQS